ncbi:hypothetical protein A2U01_0034932 [Trifolium medium]|uniref:Uncharacterized protein n=1 Tax=Trifolium medium TaxID=97028 RepID=A0A392PPZ6_9FABA|nr:hypothetical protein [Trifolium medium]
MMDSASAVNYSGPILKGNSKNNNSTLHYRYTPPSSSPTLLVLVRWVNHRWIYLWKKVKFDRKYHPISFYMDPTRRHPRLRITYTPLSSIGSSQSKVSFRGSFGSQSSIKISIKGQLWFPIL